MTMSEAHQVFVVGGPSTLIDVDLLEEIPVLGSRGGPPPDTERDYRAEALEAYASFVGPDRPTRAAVAEQLAVSERTLLRRVGPWQAFIGEAEPLRRGRA
jgi:hypothetical protein